LQGLGQKWERRVGELQTRPLRRLGQFHPLHLHLLALAQHHQIDLRAGLHLVDPADEVLGAVADRLAGELQDDVVDLQPGLLGGRPLDHRGDRDAPVLLQAQLLREQRGHLLHADAEPRAVRDAAEAQLRHQRRGERAAAQPAQPAARPRLQEQVGGLGHQLLRLLAGLGVVGVLQHQLLRLLVQLQRLHEQRRVAARAAGQRRERHVGERHHAGVGRVERVGLRLRLRRLDRLRLRQALAGDGLFDREELLRHLIDVLALAGGGIDRVAQRLQLGRHRAGLGGRQRLLEGGERLADVVNVLAAPGGGIHRLAQRGQIDRLRVGGGDGRRGRDEGERGPRRDKPREGERDGEFPDTEHIYTPLTLFGRHI
jgi:hypothetical protein